jgi:hypothetical protein
VYYAAVLEAKKEIPVYTTSGVSAGIDLALAFVGYEGSFEFPLSAGTLRRAIRNPDWSVVDDFTQTAL